MTRLIHVQLGISVVLKRDDRGTSPTSPPRVVGGGSPTRVTASDQCYERCHASPLSIFCLTYSHLPTAVPLETMPDPRTFP